MQCRLNGRKLDLAVKQIGCAAHLDLTYPIDTRGCLGGGDCLVILISEFFFVLCIVKRSEITNGGTEDECDRSKRLFDVNLTIVSEK